MQLGRYVKYGLRVAGILLGSFLLIYVGIYLYVSLHKKELINQVRTLLKEHIKSDVAIGNIGLDFFTHFPLMAVQLSSVSIRDTLYAEHHTPFLEAREVYLRINIVRLATKKNPLTGLRIENGSLNIFTDTAGRSNRYLFSAKKDSSSTGRMSETGINNIELENVGISMINQRLQKLIDLEVKSFNCDIRYDSNQAILHIRNRIFIHQLGFNLAKGSYLREKTLEGNYTLRFMETQKILAFKNILLHVQGHPFRFDGQFHFAKPSPYSFTVSTPAIDLSFAASLLTPRIAHSLGRFTVSKSVKASATITGSFQPGEPLVQVGFTATHNDVQTPLAHFVNSSFSGTYTNELAPGLPRTDENSAIQINGFKGNMEGIDLQSDSIRFNNLIQPLVICDLRSDFELATLNNLLGSHSFQLKSGRGKLDIHYKGPLTDTTNVTPDVHGVLLMERGRLLYRPRGINMNDCTGVVSFEGADASVQNMHCLIADNRITMNGRIAQLLTLMKSEPEKIGLNWTVSSPSLNLESFTDLLQARSRPGETEKRRGKFASIASQIDRMMDQSTIDLDLRAARLHYRRFAASDFKAIVHLDKDKWTLRKVSCQHAGGMFALNGTISPQGRYNLASLQATFNNIDIHRLMYAFDNFGQQGISSDNIQGKLTADATVHMLLKKTDKVIVSDMAGIVNFSLKEGALLNYEPMQNLQSYFAKRDMNHIYFAELKDRLTISEGDIDISKMEIQSTAFSIVVQGVYSLRGRTNITIQVPLSNLKKRNDSYIPVNRGTEAKRGMSIFLRGRPDKDGRIRFRYDPFKKFRKKDSTQTIPD